MSESPPFDTTTPEGLVPLVYKAINECEALTEFGKAVEISQRLALAGFALRGEEGSTQPTRDQIAAVISDSAVPGIPGALAFPAADALIARGWLGVSDTQEGTP